MLGALEGARDSSPTSTAVGDNVGSPPDVDRNEGLRVKIRDGASLGIVDATLGVPEGGRDGSPVIAVGDEVTTLGDGVGAIV